MTGASRGLGHAIATTALARGDKVCILARDQGVVDIAKALGPNAMGIAADVTREEDIQQACAQIAEQWGGIDVLVNNAGLHRGGRVESLELDDWEQSLATNLTGPMKTVRHALSHMSEGGSIINIGAVVGFRGFPGDSSYGASKAGLAGLTQVLAVELAGRGVRVNLVVPGFVSTEMTQGLSERAKDAIIAKIPLGRMGNAEEVADVCWWVAGATYMTGSVIMTDGGLMCSL